MNKLLALLLVIPFISLASASVFDNTTLYYNFDSSKELVSGIYNLTANEGTVGYNASNCLIGSCGQYAVNNNNILPGDNLTILDFNSTYTLNIWARLTNANNLDDINIFGRANNTGRLGAFNTTSWLWNGITTSGNLITGRTAVQNNTYKMLTISRKSDGNVTIYINGIIESSSMVGVSWNSSGTRRLFLGSNFNNLQDINGQLDEFGIWNSSLTDSDVLTLYNGGSGLAFGSTTSPTVVTLNYPTNGSIISTTNSSFNATIVPAATSNLTNATIFLWNSSSTLLNRTTVIISGNSTVSFAQQLYGLADSGARYFWNVEACETNSSGAGICTQQSSNNTFQRTLLSVVTENYSLSVYETSNETFNINISLDPSATLFSASLVYNGSHYISNSLVSLGSGLYSAQRIIDIPAILSNTTKNFYWEFTLDVGSGFSLVNSTQHSQSIAKTDILTTGASTAINYTIFDEDTLGLLNASFDATFNWFLGKGTQVQNTSFSRSKASNFNFFLSPSNNITFYTDSFINLANATSIPPNLINGTYNPRIYEFNLDNFNATQTNRELYMMNNNNGTDYIVQVRSSGLIVSPNIYVSIKRYYPGLNQYRTIENRKTDDFGQFTARLISNSVKYKFQFYDSNNTLLKETGDVFVTCAAGVGCTLPFVLQDNGPSLNRYTAIPGFAVNFTFFNATNVFSFVWNDDTGKSATVRLQVERVLFNGTTILCNQTSTDVSGRLTCSVGSQRASYRAQIFRRVGTKETRIADSITGGVINNKVGDLSSRFGLEGLMWSFVLLFTMLALGKDYPIIGVTLYLVGFVLLGMFDIVYITPAIAIAEIAIGVLFIWAFRG